MDLTKYFFNIYEKIILPQNYCKIMSSIEHNLQFVHKMIPEIWCNMLMPFFRTTISICSCATKSNMFVVLNMHLRKLVLTKPVKQKRQVMGFFYIVKMG